MLDHYCPDTAYGTPWPIGGQNSPCIGVINIDLSAGAAGTIFFTAPFDNVKSVSVPAPGPKTRTRTRSSWVSTTQESLKAIGSISTVVSAGARLTALPSGHEKSVCLGTAIFVPGSASPKLMTKAYPLDSGHPRCSSRGLRRAGCSCIVLTCPPDGHQIAPCRASSSRRGFPTTRPARNTSFSSTGQTGSSVRFVAAERPGLWTATARHGNAPGVGGPLSDCRHLDA